VHWSDGSFGVFRAMPGQHDGGAAWQRLLVLRPTLEEEFARGEFGWLLRWLRENIHVHGRRYGGLELIQRATGKELSRSPSCNIAGAVWHALSSVNLKSKKRQVTKWRLAGDLFGVRTLRGLEFFRWP